MIADVFSAVFHRLYHFVFYELMMVTVGFFAALFQAAAKSCSGYHTNSHTHKEFIGTSVTAHTLHLLWYSYFYSLC